MAVITDPGDSKTCKLTRDDEYSGKICKKCNIAKPKRAHHCSICKRCVLRMDHHCMCLFELSFVLYSLSLFAGPWINNCVGLNNYRYFICFLLWTTVATFYIAAVTAPYAFAPNSILRLTCAEFLLSMSEVWSGWTNNLRGSTNTTTRRLAVSALISGPLRPFLRDATLEALLQEFAAEEVIVFAMFSICTGVFIGVSTLLSFHAYLGKLFASVLRSSSNRQQWLPV